MNDFDFLTLIRYLASKKKYFLFSALIGVVLGVVVVFSIPKTYTSQMSLAIESQREPKMSGGMSTLASMAGVNMGSGQDAISPELYPDVISTNKFLIDLLSTPVQTLKGKNYKNYVDFSRSEERSPWWSEALRGTIAGVKSLFGVKASVTEFPKNGVEPTHLSADEEQVVAGIRGSLNCDVSKESDVVKLSFMSQDPLVAKMMTDAAQKRLQLFIIEYRTNKACADYKYYVSLEEQLRAKYKTAQSKFATYADSHQDLELKSYETKLTDLENEMQNAFNAYTQMKQQVQMAEAKIQERTPVFTVVEDAYVPLRPTAPKKALILVAFFFLSLAGTGCYFYFKLLFGKTSRE